MPRIYAPGPIDLPDIIKKELLVDPPYFGSKKFHNIIEKMQGQLQTLFQTKNPVLLCTGSGSLLMEQVILNFFSPNSKIVVINSGRYGQHWIDCAKIHGLHVKEIKANLTATKGISTSTEEIDQWLKDHPDTQGVFCQHVETTTGIKNNIKEISKSVRKHTNALFIVDAISSFLSEDVRVDEWDLDVVLVSSQKGLSLPPGLGLLSVSKKAEQFCCASTFPKYYFDVKTELDRQITKHQTRFTPATQVIMCLSKLLDFLEPIDESIQIIFKNTNIDSNKAASFLFSNNILIPYSNTPNSTIIVGLLPEDINPTLFFNTLETKYDYYLGRGTELIKDRGVRIRTFGWDLSYTDLSTVLYTIDNLIHDIRRGIEK